MGGAFGGTPVATGIGNYGIAGTARATYAPILDAVQVLHLGVAGSYRALDRSGTALSFSDKPENYLFSTSLISTGSIRNADAVGRFGLEGAYQYRLGPAAERIRPDHRVRRRRAGPDLPGRLCRNSAGW